MKTATMYIPFELQHLKQISEFSETLFSSHLQAGYHVNCVPNGSWIHCSEVFKVIWSKELSDSVQQLPMSGIRNYTLYVRLYKPNHETDKSLEHPVMYIRSFKFQR